MKNPCLECINRDGDKNRPECKNCRKRLEYVGGLGSMSFSVPIDKTNLTGAGHGDGGHYMATGRQPEMDDRERRFVDDRCKEHGISIDELLDSSKRTKELVQIRVTISGQLMKELGLNVKECAEAFGVSTFTVNNWKKRSAEYAPPPVRAKSPGDPIEAIFAGHPEALADLRTLAEEELRTPENQLIYLVKTASRR